MSVIWTPRIQTPQLGAEAKATTLDRVLGDGVLKTGIASWEELLQRDEPLADCVEALGRHLGKTDAAGLSINIPPEYHEIVDIHGFWAQGVLKMAAGITMLAYREAGYVAPVDGQAIETGALFAEVTGIPEAYGVSSHEDATLLNMVDTLSAVPMLEDVVVGPDRDKVQTTLHIGAGCTRHYLQQALQLAA
jgi:hypothetical protein